MKQTCKFIEEINTRQNELEWYILHFNVLTTDYENEIIFTTYEEALNNFLKAKPYHCYDRIELIYSPMDETKENVVIFSKQQTLRTILDKYRDVVVYEDKDIIIIDSASSTSLRVVCEELKINYEGDNVVDSIVSHQIYLNKEKVGHLYV